VATRQEFVLMQSFDDPAGEKILQKGTGQGQLAQACAG
jgi:hypothetical protein